MYKKKTHPIVIKYGGSLLTNKAVQRAFLKNLIWFSKTCGVVIVHGGGKEITKYLNAFRVRTRFVRGLRYTDERTLDVVQMVLSGKVNKDIVALINQLGASAAGISARDNQTIIAKQIPSLGRVGVPVDVCTRLLKSLLIAGIIPVVSPVGCDRKGNPLNINADTAACAIAIALKAKKLIFLTDVPGILDVKGKRIPKIFVRDINSLIKNNIVTGGMIPKLKAASDAIKKGVQEVDIIPGGREISLQRGTMIVG